MPVQISVKASVSCWFPRTPFTNKLEDKTYVFGQELLKLVPFELVVMIQIKLIKLCVDPGFHLVLPLFSCNPVLEALRLSEESIFTVWIDLRLAV